MRTTSPVDARRAPRHASTHSRRREISFFFPHRARASDHPVRVPFVASSSSRFDSRARVKKKETYRNYQTPLDHPRGRRRRRRRPRRRPPVCSSGAAARIRSPSAPPGRSPRWMTPVPVPASASVPVPLPVRSTGVNPRNHPPSWTCSVQFVVVVVGRARCSPRSSRVACWGGGGVSSRPMHFGFFIFNRWTL